MNIIELIRISPSEKSITKVKTIVFTKEEKKIFNEENKCLNKQKEELNNLSKNKHIN